MAQRRNMARPRETILQAATERFSVAGYTGTTMREIAAAVGVLPGSLYAHIETKESLLLEIVESGIDEFIAAVRPIAASSDPAEVRMRQAIKAHVAVVAQSPERTLVVFHQWRFLVGDKRTAVIAKRSDYENLLGGIFTAGVDSGVFNSGLDANIALLTVLGALNWTPEWFSTRGPSGADKIGETLADTLLLGLLAPRLNPAHDTARVTALRAP